MSLGLVAARLRARIWQRTILALVVSALPLGVTGLMHMITVEQKSSIEPAIALVIAATILFANALLWMRISIWRHTGEAIDWMRQGRRPTEEERQRVMALPRRITRGAIPLWVPVAVTFASLNIWLTTFSVARSIASAVLGAFCASLVSLGLIYLWTDDATRPLYQLVLRGVTDHARTEGGVRRHFHLYWLAGSASYIGGILSILIVFNSPVHAPAAAACCLLGLAVGFLMTNLAARSVSEPLEKVRAGMTPIGEGVLDASIDVDDPGDVGELQAGFNRMASRPARA